MKMIRWGILGCGNVTEVKSGPGFQKAQGSSLVAVMRRDAAKAEDYARRHSVPRWYTDADALIADPEVDAVYVATPPGSHEDYALRVCAAGKPCYVEKPMARNAAEAGRMVDAFAAAGLPLFVAYYRRALPRFLKVSELISAGEMMAARGAAGTGGKGGGANEGLGLVRRIEYRYADGKMRQRAEPVPWRLQAQEAGAGLFLDLGSHVLDLFDLWLGPLRVTQSAAGNRARAYDVEDHVSIALAAEGGTTGAVTFDFTSEAAADEFTVSFERGTVRLSCFGNEAVRIAGPQGQEATLVDLPNPPHVAQPLIQTVVDDLGGAGKCQSTGVSARRTQRVMDEVLANYYGGREDGFWQRRWPGAGGATSSKSSTS